MHYDGYVTIVVMQPSWIYNELIIVYIDAKYKVRSMAGDQLKIDYQEMWEID